MKTLALMIAAALVLPAGAQDKGRKVDRVPDGYTFVKAEGNRNFYHKVKLSALPAAHKSTGPGDMKKYKQFLIDQLSAGVPVEELVAKKYIAPAQTEWFRKYYKRVEDIVYTETAAPPVPAKPADGPAEAFMGEMLYGPNQHAIALTRFQVRDAKGKAEGGMLDTRYEDVLLVFVDAYGRPDFSKGRFRIPASEFSNKYTGGVRTLRTQEGLEKYRVDSF